MKKTLIILFLASLVLLVSCGQKDQTKLYGTWESKKITYDTEKRMEVVKEVKFRFTENGNLNVIPQRRENGKIIDEAQNNYKYKFKGSNEVVISKGNNRYRASYIFTKPDGLTLEFNSYFQGRKTYRFNRAK